MLDDRIPRYRWFQVVFGFFVGIVTGLVFDILILSLLGFAVLVLDQLVGSVPDPPTWLAVLIGSGMLILPGYFAYRMGVREARIRLLEDREESHRCLDCGFWLRGIRDSTDRCPECGKVFRKWS